MSKINSYPLKKSKNFFKDASDINEIDNSTNAGSAQTLMSKEENEEDSQVPKIILKINNFPPIIQEDLLFEEIQQKLENPDYQQEELVNDMKLLINRNAFIKEFKKHPFLDKNSFEIFGNQSASKIIFILNLINYMNIINAISYYTSKHPEQFPVILNKLNINFSYVEDENNKQYANVILMVPKSPVLYNYISTHGNLGIKDENYKNLVKDYCTFGNKYTFDNGYCYEDLSVSHLIELLGENTFEIRPNVMYYIENDAAQKLVDLKLVEIPKKYKLNNSINKAKYSGYNERDLIISMLQTVKIELNINFRKIISHGLKVNYNKLHLEKDTTYVFEIKVQISDILNEIEKIENKQNRFINALKHVKINGVFPDAKKDYKSIFMCDHNPIYVQKMARKDERLKYGKSSLLYSGVQLGITFVNTLNNNIKGLNKKIDVLEEKDESKNEKIATLEGENKSKNEKIASLENDIADLREQNKIILEELKALRKELAKKNNDVNTISDQQAKDNDRDKNDNNSDKRLRSLETVFIDNFISISSLLKEPNIGLLIRETFETVFKCFEKILEEILQNNDNMLCSKIESLINDKGNISVANVKKLLSDKIEKDNSCSPYYEAIKELLFGIDEKANCDVLIGLEKEKKQYLIKLIGYVEIFENNQGIHDIERKLEGALLYIILELLGIEKFNSLVVDVNKKNVANDKLLMKLLIRSINLVNNDINN